MKALPSYSDDEVRVFHPYFESALNEVIDVLGLGAEVEVIHHWTHSSFPGIVDFVIQNRKSKKVLLPIELKKTPEDMRAIGRAQARRYSENLGPFKGSNFYCTSNLEFVELFLETEDRVLTLAQMLDLKHGNVGKFNETEAGQFREQLKKSIGEVLGLVQGNDGTRFASNISGLLAALQTSVSDMHSWHQASKFFAFELIRRALGTDSESPSNVKDWVKADAYFDKEEVMNALLGATGFRLISRDTGKGRFNRDEIRQIIAGAYESPEPTAQIENLNSIVNEIALEVLQLPGVVRTTPDLAKVLANHLLQGNNVLENSKNRVLEPGCGTGTLLMAVKARFPNLRASQIIALEREELFSNALALRVGFSFLDSIKNNQMPDLRISDALTLEPSELTEVRCVIMNPPFVRGIDSKIEKIEFAKKISSITNKEPCLSGGQLGLECSYLEFVVASVPEGTRIATVFPANALLRTDSAEVREYLVNEFGLEEIVVYNTKGVFEDVQKNTVILIGTKKKVSSAVEVFSYSMSLSEVPIGDPTNLVSSNSAVTRRSISSGELTATIAIGWKRILSSGFEDIQNEVTKSLARHDLKSLAQIAEISRGTAGNYGCSEIIFNPGVSASDSRLLPPEHWNGIPRNWIYPAAKKSGRLPRFINDTSGESAISFRNLLNQDSGQLPPNLDAIMSKFQELSNSATSATKKQRKKSKDPREIHKILTKTVPLEGNLVLVPRAQRRYGQIGISIGSRTVVSTNFFVITCPTSRNAVILAAWLLSSFGQLQLEVNGISQEGMRKIEEGQLLGILTPDPNSIIDDEFQELEMLFEHTAPLDFYNLKESQLDHFWANYLEPSMAEDSLISVREHLAALCHERLKG